MIMELDLEELNVIYDQINCEIVEEDHMDGSPVEYYLDYITGFASFLYTELETKRREMEIENDELVTKVIITGSKDMTVNDLKVRLTPNYMEQDKHVIYINFGLELV